MPGKERRGGVSSFPPLKKWWLRDSRSSRYDKSGASPQTDFGGLGMIKK
jgi:hypothetical protein